MAVHLLNYSNVAVQLKIALIELAHRVLIYLKLSISIDLIVIFFFFHILLSLALPSLLLKMSPIGLDERPVKAGVFNLNRLVRQILINS